MRLKEIRINNKYLQKDVASILNVKRNTYAMWELEHDTIPLEKLIMLCEKFNVSVDYALNLTENKQYNNSNNFNKNLYLKRLKDIRKENNITQEKLASVLNTNNSVISRYETGENFILTMFFIEYLKIFKVSADYLLGKVDNPKYLK